MVRSIKEEHDIKCRRHKRFKVTTDSDHNKMVYPNMLEQKFDAKRPNESWVSDITYIWTAEGCLYLAGVKEIYTKELVGFTLSDSPNTELTTSALKMAYHIRLEPKGVLFHSDQGSHYTSEDYFKCVAVCDGMRHSMSRRGNCWDNTPTERSFRSFKSEWMPKNGYENIDEAKQAVSAYIWDYYQSVRPHSFNDYLTPTAKERLYFNKHLL